METWLDTTMILVMVINLFILGTSGLGLCIRAVALQGVCLGVFALVANIDHLSLHVFLLAAISMGIKGIIFPRFLFRALRESNSQREHKPIIGYGSSIVFGAIFLSIAIWLSARLPQATVTLGSPLVIPIALTTILCGLFLIITRKKALMQVLGYLILENGIYIFGIALVRETPLLVEMGVLLDVFVAVFVMGIVIFHINREFDDIDTDQLSQLKD